MCLTKVDEKKKCDSGVGYKVFRKSGVNYIGEYFTEQVFRLWEVFKDPKTEPIFNGNLKYPCGFHVFMELKHARDWFRVSTNRNSFLMSWADYPVIVKVAFRDVVATGLHGITEGAKTAVAREIFLLEEIC